MTNRSREAINNVSNNESTRNHHFATLFRHNDFQDAFFDFYSHSQCRIYLLSWRRLKNKSYKWWGLQNNVPLFYIEINHENPELTLLIHVSDQKLKNTSLIQRIDQFILQNILTLSSTRWSTKNDRFTFLPFTLFKSFVFWM